MEIKELTIQAIINLCNYHSHTSKRCKDCPVNRLCNKYFISLPKYWKIPTIKDDNK